MPDFSSAPAPDAVRVADVQLKHERVREFLVDHQLQAVLLESPAAFAWFTSGGSNVLGLGQTTCASLCISATEAICLVEAPHANRVLAETLTGLPIDLWRLNWHKSLPAVVRELVGERRVGGDISRPGIEPLADPLARLRIDLTPVERVRLLDLGRAVTHAVEATLRHLEPGEMELEIAGHVAHRLLRHGMSPLEIEVAGDDRMGQHPRPIPSRETVHRRCWLAVTAMRYGLCASSGRSISYGQPNQEFRQQYEHAAIVAAAAIHYSQPGLSAALVMERIDRCYRKRNCPEAFELCPPGHLNGYRPVELPLLPESPLVLGENWSLVWRPTVGAGRQCDTLVIDSRGYETVTASRRWPHMQIEVSGHRIDRPDILVR